jgi:hypothetical protein
MEANADLRAYDSVAELPRVTDVAVVARAVLIELAAARRASVSDQGKVPRLLEERQLSREEGATPFGNALDVLQRGPEDDAERALARALAARALLAEAAAGDEDAVARDVLWLAAQTPFDATGLVDRALGERARPFWRSLADHLRHIDGGPASGVARGEALVGAAALASSADGMARELAARLAGEVRDAVVARVLSARTTGGAEGDPGSALRGELSPTPRGPVTTTLLAMSGVLLALYVARLLGSMAFAYRRPAEVSLSEDGGVRVRWRTELLGRTLRDGEVVLPRATLARAAREIRYPRLPMYAGLVALSVGSYLGVAAFVDGVRAASPSLLGTGLAVVALGLAIDFALSSIAPSARGKCRLLFVSRDGRTVCVGGVETGLADALLARLSRR